MGFAIIAEMFNRTRLLRCESHTLVRPSRFLAAFATLSAFVIGLALSSFQTQTYAAQDWAPLFVCETNRPGKYIEIRAIEEEVGKRWSAIQYTFGPESGPLELVYPRDASKGAKSLFFSHEERAGDYYVSIRFSTGGYNYRVYSRAGKREGAGVTVSNAQGKVVSEIKCIERPYMFPSYLQRALSCDMQNPHGRAACGDKPYKPTK